MTTSAPWFKVYQCFLCGEQWQDMKNPIVWKGPRYSEADYDRKAARRALWNEGAMVSTHECSSSRIGAVFVIGVKKDRADLERLAEEGT